MVFSKQPEDIQNCKMSIPSDLVLGAGISDNHSLIIKVIDHLNKFIYNNVNKKNLPSQ